MIDLLILIVTFVCCLIVNICVQVVAAVAEQSGGQLEVAKVKNLQRVIEKACGYTGQQFSFDPTTAFDLSRAKVGEEV